MTLNEYFNKKEIELHPCGKEFLKKRNDDNYDIVMSRYDTYMQKTKPVLNFYLNSKDFYEIDGSSEIPVTHAFKQKRSKSVIVTV